jgi:hypothetical protein
MSSIHFLYIVVVAPAVLHTASIFGSGKLPCFGLSSAALNEFANTDSDRIADNTITITNIVLT